MNSRLIIFLLISIFLSSSMLIKSQESEQLQSEKDTTLSAFDRFNKKAEHLFKIIPVPFVTYTQETGTSFGLAKYNLVHLSKKDTISQASKFAGVVTISTNGNMKLSGGADINFGKGKYYMITGIAVMKFPELIWGIGNIVDHKNREKILIEKWELTLNGLYEMKENFYFGFNYAFSDYWNIGKEDTSFLIQQNITGANGGILSGTLVHH